MIYTGHTFIDPDMSLPLAGYAGRTAPVAPSHKALEANWIGWNDGQRGLSLVLALDTLFSSSAFETALKQALSKKGIELAELASIASHTHFAPSIDPEKPRLGHCEPNYIADVASKIAVSVYQTIRDPRTVANVRVHCSVAPGAIYRRRRGLRVVKRCPPLERGVQMLPNAKKAIPKTLRIWRFDNPSGKAVFAFCSWPCHAVSRANQMTMSPDYVGSLRRTLREKLGPNCPILFLPGPCGDIRPDFRKRGGFQGLYPYLWQSQFALPELAQERDFDAGLCDAALTALATPAEADWNTCEFNCSISSIQVKLDNLLGLKQPEPMIISSLSLFGLRILAAGAELNSVWLAELGWSGNEPDRVLTGYTGSCFGYLPTDDQITEGGYEVSGFANPFGLLGSFDPARPVGPTVRSAFERVFSNP